MVGVFPFKFEDINYAVASREDKETMFLEYSELLNSLDSGAATKITINNRRWNKADFEQTILIPMADDDLDKYRKIGMKIRNEASIVSSDIFYLGKCIFFQLASSLFSDAGDSAKKNVDGLPQAWYIILPVLYLFQ